MRSVEGATQAAKAASLERGMQAAFVFATADRAAAMLKVCVTPIRSLHDVSLDKLFPPVVLALLLSIATVVHLSADAVCLIHHVVCVF